MHIYFKSMVNLRPRVNGASCPAHKSYINAIKGPSDSKNYVPSLQALTYGELRIGHGCDSHPQRSPSWDRDGAI
jgi:hypothetical protein